MKTEIKKLAEIFYEETKKCPPKELEVFVDAFIDFLNQKNKLAYCNQILAEFRRLYNQENNITEAQIVSAFELTPENELLIVNMLTSRIAKKIEITKVVNPELIGGFKVTANDYLFDGSLTSVLNNLRQKLSA